MNLPLNPKHIAQTALLNGHLIPAGERILEIIGRADLNWRQNHMGVPISTELKTPQEAGIARTDAPKSPRRYVKRKPKLPLTPVTKNGKHLFIIYPK